MRVTIPRAPWRRAHASVSFALLALFGCQAEDPEVASFDSGMEEPEPREQRREQCPDVDPEAYISQLNAPETTSASLQAVRGVAVGATDVVARVGNVIQGRGTVSTDGRFCVEVRLVANTQTTVDLIPRTEDACPGQPRQVRLTHQYEPGSTTAPTTSPVQRPHNVALGKPVFSDFHTVESGGGAKTAVTDGYSDTFAVFSRWDVLGNQSVWLRVDLGQIYTIAEFRIEWAPDSADAWARHYSIYATAATHPGDPTDLGAASQWQQVIEVTDSQWGQQVRRVGGVPARSIALVLHADNTFLSDTFHVAEFSAYTTTSQQTPVGGSTHDTCP